MGEIIEDNEEEEKLVESPKQQVQEIRLSHACLLGSTGYQPVVRGSLARTWWINYSASQAYIRQAAECYRPAACAPQILALFARW